MDDRVLRRLQEENRELRRNAVRFRIGEVTDDSPLTVTLGAATTTYASVTRLASYTPTITDKVLVAIRGNDLIVLGEIA